LGNLPLNIKINHAKNPKILRGHKNDKALQTTCLQGFTV
jgi:hypothetical protein